MSTELHIAKHVLEEYVGDEVVLLSLKNETFYRLNATGQVLWRCLKEGSTEDTLVSELVDSFGINRDQAAGDVRQFIGSLRELHILAD